MKNAKGTQLEAKMDQYKTSDITFDLVSSKN